MASDLLTFSDPDGNAPINKKRIWAIASSLEESLTKIDKALMSKEHTNFSDNDIDLPF